MGLTLQCVLSDTYPSASRMCVFVENAKPDGYSIVACASLKHCVAASVFKTLIEAPCWNAVKKS